MLRSSFIILLLVGAAGFFCSCGNRNDYSITGNLPTRYDGCRVRLAPAAFYFSEEKACPVDSVEIKNGSIPVSWDYSRADGLYGDD